MNRGLRWLLPACLMLLALPAQAQDYGTGITVEVPMAEASAMVMDGVADEAAWENAPTVDILNKIDFYGPDGNIADYTGSTTKMLYSEDTLYVFIELEDNAFFFGRDGNPWTGDHLLVGIDATHAGDDMTDESYAGWPANAPGNGPTTYKITHPDSGGITLNWGYDGVDAQAEGWVNGTVFVDEDALVWGVEAAFYVPGVAPGSKIGFNVGGSQASEEIFEANGGIEGEAEGNYGYYSWQIGTGPFGAGGAVMADASSFSTLEFVTGGTSVEGPAAGNASRSALRQNFPNPARGVTTIAYDLKKAGRVQIDVYNTLGQRVTTLDQGLQAAGSYPATLDAAALASGVYVYQLVVDGKVAGAKKMIVVK